MLSKSALKRAFWIVMDSLLILFVIPFGFVISYYFYLFFSGENRPGLLGDVMELSVRLSWVSCAFLFLIALVLRALINQHKRWYALFALSFVGGGLWIVLLNVFVETAFTFWRTLFPLTLCCVVSTGYALSKALYKDDSWNFSDEPQFDYHEGEPEAVEVPEMQESVSNDQEANSV